MGWLLWKNGISRALRCNSHLVGELMVLRAIIRQKGEQRLSPPHDSTGVRIDQTQRRGDQR